MNCDLCEKHIIATTQIAWHGGNYHADCIGEAVSKHRAEQEAPLQVEDFSDEMFEEQFDQDFENYEAQEDLDEYEDLAEVIARLDENDQTNGNHVIIPEVVAPVSFVEPKTNGTLMAHCGASRISRGGLLGLPLPEETDTFKPISHYFLVQAIEEALSFRHISITKEEFAITPDGMKFFSVLQVNAQYEGVNFAIGLRNSNDKSMRLGIVAGYKVFVCDNLSFAGEYKPMLAKHSKNLDLVESVSIAVDRLQRGWKPIREMIDFKRQHQLTDGKARDMLYQLFTDAKLPISLFRTTHKEFFTQPSYDEFKPRTLWSLENAVTTSLKKLNPISQYENTAKLGKFITEYTAGI